MLLALDNLLNKLTPINFNYSGTKREAMNYHFRKRWLDLKYYMIAKKHYLLSGLLFILFITLVIIFTSPIASRSKGKIENKSHDYFTNAGYAANVKSKNLLYPLFKKDIEENSDEFAIEDDFVEYDGYFKQMEFRTYNIRKNDTLSGIARKFKSNIDTIISYNQIKSVRSLKIGKNLVIPNMKGILHNVKNGETLKSIADSYKKYNVRIKDIGYINEIDESYRITPGERLFIPGARLPKDSPLRKLKDLNIFAKPVSGVLVSAVGGRYHPVHGRYKFHPGLDIKAKYGSPVRAARSGVVTFAGWQGGYGKLIKISHGKGLETRYGHLSKIRVRKGMKISRKQLIGNVGSTGISTGPHLHFEVRKDNKPKRILKNKKLKGLEGYIGGKW